MATFFISRHPGAQQWARCQQLPVNHWVVHLDITQIQPGDTVIGTLPVNLAAAVCMRGARYLHLSLTLPAEARGRELSADELTQYGARLRGFNIQPGEPPL
ncbi:MAG: CRISPR-associated protein Csx16 [Alcanivoracaceae bacterium]